MRSAERSPSDQHEASQEGGFGTTGGLHRTWMFSEGEACGPYAILGRIAQGGFGDVYRVRNVDGRIFALKAMHMRSDRERKAGRRLVQEGKILRDLEHVNVVRYHDFGIREDNLRIWIVMELLQGLTLRQVITDPRQKMGVERALILAAQAARGLAAAHAKGTVHRDVKPENIVILPNDMVKVIDFGIAKVEQSNIHTTRPNALGTALYMCADYLTHEGDGPPDPRWDVYALGVTLWEMLRRHHPLLKDGEVQPSTMLVLSRQLHMRIPPLHEVHAHYPKSLSDVVARATASDPELRTASMEQLADELDQERRKWCEGFNPGPPAVRLSDVETMLRSGPRSVPASAPGSASVEPEDFGVSDTPGQTPLTGPPLSASTEPLSARALDAALGVGPRWLTTHPDRVAIVPPTRPLVAPSPDLPPTSRPALPFAAPTAADFFRAAPTLPPRGKVEAEPEARVIVSASGVLPPQPPSRGRANPPQTAAFPWRAVLTIVVGGPLGGAALLLVLAMAGLFGRTPPRDLRRVPMPRMIVWVVPAPPPVVVEVPAAPAPPPTPPRAAPIPPRPAPKPSARPAATLQPDAHFFPGDPF